MFDLRLKTSVTFSFAKLREQLEKSLPEALKGTRETVAKRWKENIDGQKFDALRPSTKLRRKKTGYNSFYPGIKPKDTTTILKATGKFYDSIKANDRGVEFNHYGNWHITGKDKRPVRDWRGETKAILSSKSLKKLQSDIKNSFKIPKKNIRDMKF